MRKLHYLPTIAVILGLAGRAMAMQTGSAEAVATPTVEYTVQSGDTLGSIAQAFHSTVQAIASRNQLSDPNLIYPGERLMVPSQNTGLPSGAQPVVCTLTADTDGYASTGKMPGQPGYGITSTGQVAMQGLTVAVDPNVIPYGTPLLIPGVGVRIAEDTGGAIIGDHIDVFYNSNQTALDFGVKRGILVYILPKRDVAFMHHLPVLAQDVQRAQASVRHASGHGQVYTSSAVLKAAASLSAPSATGLAAALLATAVPPHPPGQAAFAPPSPQPVPDQAASVRPLGAISEPTLTVRRVRPTVSRARAVIRTEASAPRIDVLDAWNVVLEQDVWQPMLRAAKNAV